MKKIKNIWLVAMTGILTIFCFYFTWGLVTVANKMNISFLFCLFVLLTGFFYLCFQHFMKANDSYYPKYYEQLLKINSGFLLVGIIIYFTMVKERIDQKEYLYLLGYFVWLVVLCIAEYKLLQGKINSKVFASFVDFIKEHKWLWLLLIIVGGLAPDYHGTQFKWDGILYYITCHNISLDSMSSLAIYGHIAQTFGAMIQIGTQLFGNVAVSMTFMNILLLLTSSCAFYGTLKVIVPNKNDFLYTLGTAAYAFSPFLLGMVNYYNLDYFCLCFSTFVFYYGCKKQWLKFFVFGLLFCFTKEPAIIIYGCFCAGVVLVEFIQDKEKSLGKRIGNIFKHSKYYMMAVPGVLWLVTYLILGPWSAGNSETGIDLTYIIEKLKVLYLLNFNWVYTLIILIGIFYILSKGKKVIEENYWLLPLFLGQVGFTVFSCLLKTVNHPRYSDSSPVFLCFVSIVFILKWIAKERVRNGVLIVLACLMLMSSYYTLDSVTRIVFEKVNIGQTTMVVPQPNAPGDGMIYNKQMLYLEQAMEEALEESVKNQELIVFPTVEQSTYYFDGMAEVTSVQEDEYRIETELWDSVCRKRRAVNTGGFQEIEVAHIGGMKGLEKLLKEYDKDYSSVSFFYLPFAGNELAQDIKEKYDIVNELDYSISGWTVRKLIFDMY